MIFVDSSALFALVDRTDRYHDTASAQWEQLVPERPALHTSNYVVLESATFLQARLGLQAVRDLRERLLPLMNVHFIDAPLHDAALDLAMMEKKRNLSVVDCSSFLLMRRNAWSRVFAFDEHFRRFGFELL